jgi:hypothetical protein
MSTTDESKAQSDKADLRAQIKRAEEIADLYKDDDRPCIKTDVMNAFYRGVAWRQVNPFIASTPLAIEAPLTYGGFRGAFYVTQRRAPTDQEIFDAGVRAGLRLAAERSATPEEHHELGS